MISTVLRNVRSPTKLNHTYPCKHLHTYVCRCSFWIFALVLNHVSSYRLDSQLVHKQRQIALFSEMVHSASLVHDDVIDQSDFRRGKPSVNALWNHKKVRIDPRDMGDMACGIIDATDVCQSQTNKAKHTPRVARQPKQPNSNHWGPKPDFDINLLRISI